MRTKNISKWQPGIIKDRLTILSGIKYRYTKSGYRKIYRECQCICGVKKYICQSDLSKVNSCGCKNDQNRRTIKNNLIGKEFGFLTVLSRSVGVKNYGRKPMVMYVCRCVCGKECINSYTNLIKDNVISCGDCGKHKNGHTVSGVQLRLFKMLNRGVLNFKIDNKRSVDIALVYNNKKVAVEYNGWRWHKNNRNADTNKQQILLDENWYLLNINSSRKLPTLEEIYTKLDQLSINNKIATITLDDWGDPNDN